MLDRMLAFALLGLDHMNGLQYLSRVSRNISSLTFLSKHGRARNHSQTCSRISAVPASSGVLHPPGQVKTGSTGGGGARSARRTRRLLPPIVRAARPAEPSPVLVAMIVMVLACRRRC
jgi:hypothetical protein